MKLKYIVSPIIHNVLPKDLLQFNIEETKANCENCSMQPKYKANLKCCTFEPFLPNFYVGAILKNNLPGSDVIEDKIKRRSYVLPIGTVAPISFQVAFNQRKDEDFGNRQDWLCPYYDKEENNCRIWAHRGVVCTTFYCKSSYGRSGKIFWSKLSDYLSYVEMALHEEALVQLDFSPRQISDNIEYINRKKGSSRELRSDSLPLSLYRKLWNGYAGQEKEFYIRCSEIVSQLKRRDFIEIAGDLGKKLEESVFDKLYKLPNE